MGLALDGCDCDRMKPSRILIGEFRENPGLFPIKPLYLTLTGRAFLRPVTIRVWAASASAVARVLAESR